MKLASVGENPPRGISSLKNPRNAGLAPLDWLAKQYSYLSFDFISDFSYFL
jgi:hypothetical protein